MKVRVRFSKVGVLKYVGHLDMMRYFQKAISRAKLPIAYSEGFNPHQIMSFGNPLGLGMTSKSEYMDIELTVEVTSQEGVDRLNAVMVDGIEVLSFKYLPDKTKNAMASITAASYEIQLKDDVLACVDSSVDFVKLIDEFMKQDECIIIKKTKKSEKEIDILPLIYDFSYNNDTFTILCSAGSNDNIKPEIIINALFKFAGIEGDVDRIGLDIMRMDLYSGDKDELVSLDDVGEII